MRTSDFDYFLPDECIAAFPTAQRDGSRLLCLGRREGVAIHTEFAQIAAHLPAEALIVLNDTRVIPARLRGKKATGGAIELLLTRCDRIGDDGPEMAWEALGRNLRWAGVGTELTFAEGLVARITRRGNAGALDVRLRAPAGSTVMQMLERVGELPLPPYIEVARKRRGEADRGGEAVGSAKEGATTGLGPADSAALDRERYQTVFAAEAGAVAAPTAGLHFTEALLSSLQARGHRIARLTLHVGLGTFRPVKTEAAEDHPMEAETYTISAETAAAVNEAHRLGRPVVAVGTTVVRALESAARAARGDNGDGEADATTAQGRLDTGPGAVRVAAASQTARDEIIRPGTASSRLFLRPGSRFHVVTDLITNFHLPRSTLLMLVSAFAGRERILAAYAEAVATGYRFYSYGDAMLITGRP